MLYVAAHSQLSNNIKLQWVNACATIAIAAELKWGKMTGEQGVGKEGNRKALLTVEEMKEKEGTVHKDQVTDQCTRRHHAGCIPQDRHRWKIRQCFYRRSDTCWLGCCTRQRLKPLSSPSSSSYYSSFKKDHSAFTKIWNHHDHHKGTSVASDKDLHSFMKIWNHHHHQVITAALKKKDLHSLI